MREKNSRETILNCALELFANKGYEAVSPNEIVAKAGITKPTLYYFFGNKEGLFDQLLQTYYEKLNQLLEQTCIYNPKNNNYYEDVYPVLLHTVDVLFQFAQEHTDFYMMVLSLSFSPPSSKSAQVSGKYHKNQYEIMEHMFYDISSKHTNLKGKERAYAWHFLEMINAQIGFWYRGYDELNEDIAKAIVKQFMHGIFS